jgi:hypothetical protein
MRAVLEGRVEQQWQRQGLSGEDPVYPGLEHVWSLICWTAPAVGTTNMKLLVCLVALGLLDTYNGPLGKSVNVTGSLVKQCR